MTQIDPLLGQADTLVAGARKNAASLYTVLLKDFSCLQRARPEQWAFLLTIAGVFVAATRLGNLRFAESREQTLIAQISERLQIWDPANGFRAFEDCKSFYDRTSDGLEDIGHDARFVTADAVGGWIVWNAFGRAPVGDEEKKLVRVVGASITHTFYHWWD